MFKRSIHLTISAFFLLALLVAFTGCVDPFDEGDYPFDDSGVIETEYALSGPYNVTQTKVTGFTIFYPMQMDGGHPIITWGNGTGAATQTYVPLLRHLASWGFVVVASDSKQTGSGVEMLEGVDYMLEQNMKPGSPFYGKLDPGSIGATGHSQGGGGSINAATDPRVTSTMPIAPARGEIDQVKCPIFLIAGTDDMTVPANFVRRTSYNPAKATTMLGILEGMNHGDFTGDFGKARGYITAWFMYQLKGDATATQAFIDECEICGNPDWTVSKKNF